MIQDLGESPMPSGLVIEGQLAYCRVSHIDH